MGLITPDPDDHPGPPPRLELRRCEHVRLRQVWRVFEGKDRTKRYGFQCLDCGSSGYKCASGDLTSQWVGARKCFDYMNYPPHEAVSYHDAITADLKARQNAFYAELHSPETRVARRQAWWDWYDAYLNSGAWQAKRRQIMERDRGVCARCWGPATEVHHLSYASVGYESLADLMAVCSACHVAIHAGVVE